MATLQQKSAPKVRGNAPIPVLTVTIEPSFTQEKIAYGLHACMGMNDIADRIGITYKTAISHKKNIMNKFDLNSKLELYEFIACYHKKKH
jgi:DNA-binding NarL/FixJ family response regulator